MRYTLVSERKERLHFLLFSKSSVIWVYFLFVIVADRWTWPSLNCWQHCDLNTPPVWPLQVHAQGLLVQQVCL